MEDVYLLIQLILSVLIIGAVLVQNKGGGFGRAWSAGPSSFTKRGLERLVFRATFVLTGLLVAISILELLV
jgi:protein translocase SecG subunit